MKRFLSISIACLLVLFSFSFLGCGESKITLSKTELTMDIDEVQGLTVRLENISNKTITWQSSDETVVEVEEGVITAIGTGTAQVTATTTTNQSAVCTVNVTTNHMIYQNSEGDFSDWNEAEGATGLNAVTFQNEKCASITGNGQELDYDLVNDYTTENYNFTVRYDIYISSALTGTTVTGENVVAVDVGLRSASWADYKPVFGAYQNGKVKVVFATGGNFDNGTEISANKWYTVKIVIEANANGKTIKGQVIDRETGTAVITSQNIPVPQTEAENVYANIYFPGSASETPLAYLDNFTISVSSRTAE